MTATPDDLVRGALFLLIEQGHSAREAAQTITELAWDLADERDPAPATSGPGVLTEKGQAMYADRILGAAKEGHDLLSGSVPHLYRPDLNDRGHTPRHAR